MNDFTITSDINRMDLPKIHSFISNTYWARNIPYSVFEKAVKHSLCFGVLDTAGQQVGFARVITDKATFAYLADVYVIEELRGRGLAKWLMETVFQHPELQGLRRMMLASSDAGGLYAKFGFTELTQPGIFMERWQPNVYKKA